MTAPLLVIALALLLTVRGQLPALDASDNRPDSLGKAGDVFIRPSSQPNSFADNVSSISSALPSARLVSMQMFGSDTKCNAQGLSELLSYWGMVVGLEVAEFASVLPAEPLPIAVPANDVALDPDQTGTKTLAYARVAYSANSSVAGSPRAPLNMATPFVDASFVYGVDAARLTRLRTGSGGLLRTGADGLPPRVADLGAPAFAMQTAPAPNAASADQLFAAADRRVNQHVGLLAIYCMLLRLHNWHAQRLAQASPGLDDEALFQGARRWVRAQMASITFNEYVPVLLARPLGAYKPFNASVDPRLSTWFAAVARWHWLSALSPSLLRLDEARQPAAASPLQVRDCMWQPACLAGAGALDALLRGMSAQCHQAVDLHVLQPLHPLLYAPAAPGGDDPLAAALQQARDFGASDYNAARAAYGLPPRASLAAVVNNDTALAAKLAALYGNSLAGLDSLVGALAEDTSGLRTPLGELLRAAYLSEFTRLRDGDRFYYLGSEANFSAAEQLAITHFKVADLLLLTTNISRVSCSAFYASSTLLECSLTDPAVSTPEQTVRLLDGRIEVRWTIVADVIKFRIRANTTGWVAIGFNPDAARMMGTDAAVMFVNDTTQQVSLMDASITARSGACPGLCNDSAVGGSFDLFDISGNQTGSQMEVHFSRKLSTSDPADVVLTPTKETHLVYAMSLDGSDVLRYHGSFKGSAVVVLSGGKPAIIELASKKSRLAHGVLMFIAWAVLFPIGLAFPRFIKMLWRGWFRSHIIIQYGGLFVVLAGFMVILQWVAHQQYTHFRKTHSRLGLATFLFGFIPPVLGQMSAMRWRADQISRRVIPIALHQVSGYAVIVLSWVTIFLGLRQHGGVATVIYVLVALWMALLVGIFTFLSLPRIREKWALKLLDP